MAYEIPGFSFTLVAAAALPQFTFVNINGSGQAAAPAAGGDPVGVVQNIASGAGKAATVVTNGVSMVKVGTGGLTAGGNVACDATGQAVAAAATNSILGRALETAAVGELAAVLIIPSARKV